MASFSPVGDEHRCMQLLSAYVLPRRDESAPTYRETGKGRGIGINKYTDKFLSPASDALAAMNRNILVD